MIKKLIILSTLIGVPLLAIWVYALSPVNKLDKAQYEITINNGEGVSIIAQKLREKNLIKSTLFFKVFVKLTNQSGNLKAGSYHFSPTQSIQEIITTLEAGKTEDIKITIIEGLKREEIADILQNTFGDNFKKEFLSQTINLEGKLFPDTYLVKKETTVSQFVELLTDNFEKKYQKATQNSKVNLNKEEIITLASIVEREAKADADRPIIAGILYKRLKNDWPLEADATILYIVGWKKTLTEEDLSIDSPYNTRKNPGLPPTPICNPGLASLEAAANPVTTNYWFYLSDSTGKMHYSKTLEEHQANIVKYIDKH